ncbi:hypothetical protein COO60DRAFT_1457603 [Scenedesmus sp. NREL 46B-D3]|nr:hypothetical protein COO60DRAFT_1457603 [Scenedesmus sp. NREL 46B-D3]
MDVVSQDRPRRSFSACSTGASSNAAAKKERVWVAVRIRPLLELEQLARERTAWRAVGSSSLQHVDPDKPATQCTSYQYNRVFTECSSSAQTRATRMNDNSSRSHEIVRLYVESRPASTSAGSERGSQAAESGEKEKLRQKEAGNINKSLLTLSSVVRALADNPGKRHVPYRDSKLTRLLQSSLSGNSHMAIITTISPAAGSVDNTRAALQFATAAGRVVMRPQLNKVAGTRAAIKAMAAEIAQLKSRLSAVEAGQLEAGLQQQEAEATGAAQERDQLCSKLQLLQNQILRGAAGPSNSQGLEWHNRVAIAKELRASSMRVRASWAPGDNADTSRDTSGGAVWPEAEAAMAGLEVEVRCYKHVQEYTLAELAAALEHLECQQAGGQGLGSWSSDQLEALRSEVARKRAAEVLTQLGDRALDALTRKVHSYTSSADGSPFTELRRQLAGASSREVVCSGMLDTPAAAAALASAAAAGLAHAVAAGGSAAPDQRRHSWDRTAQEARSRVGSPDLPASEEGGSWPADAAPRLMSGRTTPMQSHRRGGARPASAGAAAAAAPGTPVPGAAGGAAAAACRHALVSASEDSAISSRQPSSSGGSSGRRSAVSPVGSAAAAAAQEQLTRIQEAWRESVEKDVSCLREVLAQYKEQAERLEMQKKLLLSQPRSDVASSFRPAYDGWASTPTVDSLLPKIVALWEELYVPLAYRSRFFLSFRGREVFYYEVEARRLEWKRSQMLAGAAEESSWAEQQSSNASHLGRGSYGCGEGAAPGTPTGGRGGTPRPLTSASAAAALTASSSFGGIRRRSRQLDKAARALDWERKSLAAGLKWNLTETERDELYRAWGVDPDTKERKLQLVFKLWSRETLQQPDGMARSSELVVTLCGMDASEHMMELVFGSHLREYSAAGLPSLARSSTTSGLGIAVSNIVRRLAPPLARGGGGSVSGSPMRSSASGGGLAGYSAMQRAGCVEHGPYAPPARAGGSFSSRLQNGILSLLSSRDGDRGMGALTKPAILGYQSETLALTVEALAAALSTTNRGVVSILEERPAVLLAPHEPVELLAAPVQRTKQQLEALATALDASQAACASLVQRQPHLLQMPPTVLRSRLFLLADASGVSCRELLQQLQPEHIKSLSGLLLLSPARLAQQLEVLQRLLADRQLPGRTLVRLLLHLGGWYQLIGELQQLQPSSAARGVAMARAAHKEPLFVSADCSVAQHGQDCLPQRSNQMTYGSIITARQVTGIDNLSNAK